MAKRGQRPKEVRGRVWWQPAWIIEPPKLPEKPGMIWREAVATKRLRLAAPPKKQGMIWNPRIPTHMRRTLDEVRRQSIAEDGAR